MTFGTGHHETTLLMAQALFNEKISGSDVLDMGTGTGVLAIICSKLKAKNILAIDLDPIAVQNTRDNLVVNNINTITVKEGNSSLININEYDFVLANINKNILLRDLLIYYKSLRNGGKLLMSGFFNLDNNDLLDEAAKVGLKFVDSKELNKWSLLILSK
jgi:ribosomal protein L11 methyltransferase